jgi:hypothetical protein
MQDIGVGHSADVYLTFADPRLNATDRAVSHTMVDWWVTFARTGNPNTEQQQQQQQQQLLHSESRHDRSDRKLFTPDRRVQGMEGAVGERVVAPLWPRFGEGRSNATMRIGVKSTVERQLREDVCAFWASTHQVPYDVVE